jgi:hypothetical protein
MKRLLAGIVVVAAIGAVIAGCGSGAASPRPRAAAAVKATPRLKRMLEAEITTLRLAQPKAPSVLPLTPVGPLHPHVLVFPDASAPCFVSGTAGCSDVPCREFASAPAVYRRSMGVITRQALGKRSPACTHAPRKLALVSGP